ncbi:MAG: hypothetical protein KA954_06065 [Chitinophagales bacterium]|nr:hypothetical protein [Chitinophagales bacterium]
MYQFITSITFEIVLIIVFGAGFFVMRGNLKIGEPTADFEDWRLKNGRLIRSICIMTIIVLAASIFLNYFNFLFLPPTKLKG